MDSCVKNDSLLPRGKKIPYAGKIMEKDSLDLEIIRNSRSSKNTDEQYYTSLLPAISPTYRYVFWLEQIVILYEQHP